MADAPGPWDIEPAPAVKDEQGGLVEIRCPTCMSPGGFTGATLWRCWNHHEWKCSLRDWMAGCAELKVPADRIAELLDEIGRVRKYAERMDALAEERFMEITRLQGEVAAWQAVAEDLERQLGEALVRQEQYKTMYYHLRERLERMRGESTPTE